MRNVLSEKSRRRVLSLITLTVLLLIAVVMLPSSDAWADNEEDAAGSRRDITIEVVEDIPADEIKDAEVPLAALPVSKKSNAVRHIGMMLVLLGAVCAYSAYFINYEKKLVSLRMEAAEAEDSL